MVLLIGSTGLRRSEMNALTWSDLNMRTMEVNVLRSCVRNGWKDEDRLVLRPVPLHPLVLTRSWSGVRNALFDGFGFPVSLSSIQRNKPLSPDSILEKSVRPALRGSELSENISAGTVFVTPSRPTEIAWRGHQGRTGVDAAFQLSHDARYLHPCRPAKREASLKVVELMCRWKYKTSAPFRTSETGRAS